MNEQHEFSITEKLIEVEREITIRERLYPGWVKAGRLSSERAQRQIAVLQAVAHDYREQLKCKA